MERMRDPTKDQFTLAHWLGPAPFETLCGMETVEAEGGRAVVRLPFRVKLAQGNGLLHGGALTAMADTAVAMAIKTVVPEGTQFATVELSTRFMVPVTGGVVEARARVARREGRDIEGVADLFDEFGTLVATFRSLFRVKKCQRMFGARVKEKKL